MLATFYFFTQKIHIKHGGRECMGVILIVSIIVLMFMSLDLVLFLFRFIFL